MPAALPHTGSYYAASIAPESVRASLDTAISADVCIIGGGYTGVNTALELAERGMSVVLLEAQRIGWGASGRNGGQLIRGLGHDVSGVERWVGQEGVRYLQQAGSESVDIVRRRVNDNELACDLRWGYCDLANTRAHWKGLQEELAALTAQGYPHPLRLVEKDALHDVVNSSAYVGGLVDMGSGHLHPLKLILAEARLAEAKGAILYEASPVRRIVHGSKVQVLTDHGQVSATQVVLACDAFLEKLEPELTGKLLPAGSYIIATEPLGEERARALIPQNMALCDQRVALDYYRLSADNRLLFGGACHYSGRDPANIGDYMRPKMERVFPQLKGVGIDFQWGGMIGISANRFPQIGYLPKAPNVFYAQGYSGHGLNVTHFAARILAQAIAERDSRAVELFARVPHRTFPGGARLRSPLLALGMMWYRFKELI
ncbi:gamma-glutamylputrescine oxidase [Pseudomonas sp. NFACC02]|uniref:NAD(P)/FAD-dependent oxidoreductase n=1 Tax=Pseudomonas sp. NFACC02 TaxID=1566250 RepID=UPI0008B145AE|nr:FAD-binding oxidoreductase [Pseudomonas sp. NFACC02]SEQ02898.1 gamma-glutamylputrescine oxidase [Pseudomonas sp. NFACC02]